MISVIAHEADALERNSSRLDMLGFEMAGDSDSWKDYATNIRAKEDLHPMF